MPHLTPFRARWSLLLTIHPIFLIPESLPAVDSVYQGHNASATVDEIDYLRNEIATLRSGLKQNNAKQKVIGIENLAEDSPIIEGLELYSQTLLEELEHLVNPKILSLKELVVSSNLSSLNTRAIR